MRNNKLRVELIAAHKYGLIAHKFYTQNTISMARRIPEETLQAIEAIVEAYPEGIGISDIERALNDPEIPRRTLQYRLKKLVEQGRLATEGEGRWMKYQIAPKIGGDVAMGDKVPGKDARGLIPLSKGALKIRKYVRQPVEARKPVGHSRLFLESYRTKAIDYLSGNERAHLKEVGTPAVQEQPAGTYARQIMSRLLIDLSWNSSRLEGNTYSLLDTKRLIDFGQEAEGKGQLETQMILNHKDAIEFLVESAEEIGFNRRTVLNLHALLANNLLADPEAMGRLRHIPVGIEKSAYHPLEVPQLIEEQFDLILNTATDIKDPFEQSFFVMVHLPYLQPFDDVNKRVSRLAANIPLIRANLTPLSFTDVPEDLYTQAMLGIYELNEIELLKDVYIWAYERSAARYAAVRQSLGEPDPFRLKYRKALRDLVREIVLEQMDRKTAFTHIAKWAGKHIAYRDQQQFREIAENELLGLHEGNFARYQLKPSEFSAWIKTWQDQRG